MGGKAKQWLLAVMVIIIWGVVIYRFFSFREEDSEQINPITLKSKLVNSEEILTYRFHLDYPDPFLKDLQSVSISDVENQPVTNPSVRSERTRRVIPSVLFKGSVRKGASLAALLTIEQQPFIVQTGDTCLQFVTEMIEVNHVQLRYLPFDSVLVYNLP